MARRCEICGKGPQFGNRVSHSNSKTRRKFNPNIQVVRIDGVKRKVARIGDSLDCGCKIVGGAKTVGAGANA